MPDQQKICAIFSRHWPNEPVMWLRWKSSQQRHSEVHIFSDPVNRWTVFWRDCISWDQSLIIPKFSTKWSIFIVDINHGLSTHQQEEVSRVRYKIIGRALVWNLPHVEQIFGFHTCQPPKYYKKNIVPYFQDTNQRSHTHMWLDLDVCGTSCFHWFASCMWLRWKSIQQWHSEVDIFSDPVNSMLWWFLGTGQCQTPKS